MWLEIRCSDCGFHTVVYGFVIGRNHEMQLVNSGDAGFWNPEDEDGKASRAVLPERQPRGQRDERDNLVVSDLYRRWPPRRTRHHEI
jgi:hypothetical protein